MKIKVKGLKEIEAQLVKLGSKDGTRVLRAAMLKGAKPIEEQARANASAIKRSGALGLSIGSRFLVGAQKAAASLFIQLPAMGGRFTVTIAPLLKSKLAISLYNLRYRRKRRGIYHGHFLEYGTAKSSKRPFLKPALDTRGAQAISIFADEIRKGIDRMLRRKAKR